MSLKSTPLDNSKEIDKDSIIENSAGNLYWKNKKGIYLGCNKNMATIFKLKDPNEIVGKNDWDFFHDEEHVKKIVENDQEVIASGKEKIFEEVGINAKGELATYLTKKTPLKNSAGEIIGILGTSIDITERKRAEKLQLEANKLLVEKDASDKLAKAMEMVSGFIAHEMKTPLAIVNLNNDLLSLDLKNEELDLNSPDAKERINNYHDNIQFAVYSADNIIGMLLTKLSNLKSVRLGPADYEFTPIKQTIDAAVKQYPFLKYEKPLMHWNPKANEDFKYFGRDDLTKNILFNLIRNALRAIKEYDKGEIFITLASDEKFNYLIFKDTGMGIPESHLANLFQQFNTHSNGGSGLGLAFCKMVMNSYGGDITCKSKDREFTEFTLSFPKDGGTNTTLKQKITARQAK